MDLFGTGMLLMAKVTLFALAARATTTYINALVAAIISCAGKEKYEFTIRDSYIPSIYWTVFFVLIQF